MPLSLAQRLGGGVRATPLGVGVADFFLAGVTLPSVDLGVGVTEPFLPTRLLLEPKDSVIRIKNIRRR